MDYLYSLYDALVSINVPNDKARAVVDAMERDMGTTLATKADMDNLRIATKTDLQLQRQELVSKMDGLATREELLTIRTELREEMLTIRSELREEIITLGTEMRQDMLALRAESRENIALIRKDMEILSTTMTVRLGSMLMFGLGLLFAALKLT